MGQKESAIIVLHEIYGINSHIKRVCRHYLAAGYDVLCPNFVKSEDYFDYWYVFNKPFMNPTHKLIG